jgi:hypothetical protein
MLKKLDSKQRHGWKGWDAPSLKDNFERRLIDHALRAMQGEKDQWADVANFAAFLDRIESRRGSDD